MSNDASHRKVDESGAMPPPYSGTNSLDFTGRPFAPAADPSPVVARPRKKTTSGARKKAGIFPRGAGLILAVITIAVVVAFATTKRPAEAPAKPPPATVSTVLTERIPPVPASTSAHLPPSLNPAPQPVQKPAWPADFVAAFQEYSGKAGSKAMALALDDAGKMAYIGVFERATQSEANDEALSQCTRFKAQSGVEKDCRLYAVGDTIVW